MKGRTRQTGRGAAAHTSSSVEISSSRCLREQKTRLYDQRRSKKIEAVRTNKMKAKRSHHFQCMRVFLVWGWLLCVSARSVMISKLLAGCAALSVQKQKETQESASLPAGSPWVPCRLIK